MTIEHEQPVKPTIEDTTLADIAGLRRVQAQGWNQTYPNEEVGVSAEFIKNRTDSWMTPEGMQRSEEVLAPIFESPNHLHKVAKLNGEIVGLVHASKLDHQHLEALYIQDDQRGTGLAQRMIDEVLNFLDRTKPIVLEVVTYNDRAIRFYQKNGFEILPGSEKLFAKVIPTVDMIRTGDEDEV